MIEEWRPFPDYEDDYLISNLGRVFSIRSNRCLRLKPNAHGYLRVSPSVNGNRKDIAVHRAVATAFIPNPENKATVNHINEIKTDNRVENLEWATMAEQNTHGTRIQRAVSHTDYRSRSIDYAAVAAKHNYHQINRKQMRPVIQTDEHGHFIARYDGLSEAARLIGISVGSLWKCLNGRRKTCGGYRWEYA